MVRRAATFRTASVNPPEEFDLPDVQKSVGLRPLGVSFATFLYENEAETGPLLEIPEQFTDDE
jgi:hypothetical protein